MKRRHSEGDPIEMLRHADPLDPLEVPQDTTGAHARALFQEVTSMQTTEPKTTEAPRRPVRRRLVMAISTSTAIAAVVVGVAITNNPDQPTENIVGGEPIASAAMCVETYDLGTLANREVAFDGTLETIEGDNVTFTVNRWFTGGSGSTVTLDSNGLAGGAITSVGGPSLEIGERYLVSGSGGFVWACGFTMTYDTDIANQWAEVFAG